MLFVTTFLSYVVLVLTSKNSTFTKSTQLSYEDLVAIFTCFKSNKFRQKKFVLLYSAKNIMLSNNERVLKELKKTSEPLAKAILHAGKTVDTKTITQSKKEIRLLLKAWEKDPALKRKQALAEALKVYAQYDKLGQFILKHANKSNVKKDSAINVSPEIVRNGLVAIGLVGLVGTLALAYKQEGLVNTLRSLRARFFSEIKSMFNKALDEATKEVKKQDSYAYEVITAWEHENKQVIINDGLLGFLKSLVTLPFRLVKRIISRAIIKVSLWLLKLGKYLDKALSPLAKVASKVLYFATEKVVELFIIKPLKIFVPNPMLLTPIKMVSTFLWNVFGLSFTLKLVLGPHAATAFAILYIAQKTLTVKQQTEMVASINDLVEVFAGLKDLELGDINDLETELT